MVAFKEEFPYLRSQSGQLFEFNERWLREAITRAASDAGYVLKVIGYTEIVPHFAPAPPPVKVSLFEIAHAAGGGYELAYFDMLSRQTDLLLETGVNSIQFIALNACVKHLLGTRIWSRACDVLRGEIVCFIREKISAAKQPRSLACSIC